MHYTAIRSLLLILSRFIGLPRFSYTPAVATPAAHRLGGYKYIQLVRPTRLKVDIEMTYDYYHKKYRNT